MRYPTRLLVPAALMLTLFACEQTETTTGPERVIAGPSFEANPESEGQVFVTDPFTGFQMRAPRDRCEIIDEDENPNPDWIRYTVGTDPELNATMEHEVVQKGTVSIVIFGEGTYSGEGHGVYSRKYDANGWLFSATFTIKGKLPELGLAVTCRTVINKNGQPEYFRYFEPLDD